MTADVVITMIVPKSEFGSRLQRFFEVAKSDARLGTIAKSALEVDSSLTALLQSFGRNTFWSAIRHMKGAYPYPEEDGSTFYEIRFAEVDYPYARVFAEEFKVWMDAVGCTEVASEVSNRFSETTVGNLLDVSLEYKTGNLALFLGAGVSTELGLPGWKGLLDRMIEDWRQKGLPDRQVPLGISTQSLTAQARWLKRELGDAYVESVRQALYYDAYRKGIPFSSTLEAISKMTQLRAICTYNYDDLLERHAGARFRAVASARQGYEGDQIPVYHVHGLLPFVGSPRGDIILSEEDYHALANDPMHWANVIQVNLLRECTCLLIGISATDPNLRRILDLVRDAKAGDTYIVQRMADIQDAKPETLKAWSISKEFDRDSFGDIHLQAIWIDSFNEIPSILQEFVEGSSE